MQSPTFSSIKAQENHQQTEKNSHINQSINRNLLYGVVMGSFTIIVLVSILWIRLGHKRYNYCQFHPDQCQKLDPQIQQLLANNSNSQQQGKSMVQILETHQKLKSQNIQIKNSSKVFEDMMKSLLCFHTIKPQNASQIYNNIIEMLYRDQKNLEKYLQLGLIGTNQFHSFSLNGITQKYCNFTIQNSTLKSSSLRSNSRLLQESCIQRNKVIHFVNGVGFTVGGAVQNLNKILSTIQGNSQLATYDMVSFAGPWRKQEGIVNDLILAYLQKLKEAGKNSVNRFKLLMYLKLILNAIDDKQDQDFQNFKRYYNQRTYIQILNKTLNYNVEMHAQSIKANIYRGRQIMIVAHSQGTLYANQIYNILNVQEQKSVGLVYVGAAASSMADSSNNYMTNPDDKVINLGVRLSSQILGLQEPLPSNLPGAKFETLNHGFIGYLNSYPNTFRFLIEQSDKNINTAFDNQNTEISIIEIVLMHNANPYYELSIKKPDNTYGIIQNSNKTVNGTSSYKVRCGEQVQGDYIIEIKQNSQYISIQEKPVLIIYAGQEIKVIEVQKTNQQICKICVQTKNKNQNIFQINCYE